MRLGVNVLWKNRKRAFSEDDSLAARGEVDELAMVFTSHETFKDVSRRFYQDANKMDM